MSVEDNVFTSKHPPQIYSTLSLNNRETCIIMLICVCVIVDDSFPADATVELLFSSGPQRVRGTDLLVTLFHHHSIH